MYWTDWNEKRIDRARLDGSDWEVFVNITGSRVTGMAIDYNESTIYWCDPRINSIWKVDISTRVQTELISSQDIHDCMGLAVFGDYIYWTDT